MLCWVREYGQFVFGRGGGSLQTDQYSTLDRAFGLYQNLDVKDDVDLDNKMRNYEMTTDTHRDKTKIFYKKEMGRVS